MTYQNYEQGFCKLTASDDWISQLGCYANFEARFPPTKDMEASFNTSAVLVLAIVAFVVVSRKRIL